MRIIFINGSLGFTCNLCKYFNTIVVEQHNYAYEISKKSSQARSGNVEESEVDGESHGGWRGKRKKEMHTQSNNRAQNLKLHTLNAINICSHICMAQRNFDL